MQNIRKNLINFGGRSSLHGIGYVFSSSRDSWFKRIFWVAILTMCGFGALIMLLSSLRLYSDVAVSFSVETNYLNWKTPFPAFSVCESGSPERIKDYLTSKKLPATLANFYKDVTHWNAKYCKVCNHCKLNITCSNDFRNHVRKIRLKCGQILTDCWWGNKPFRCCDRFIPMETEYGVCFTFNSKLQPGASNILTVNRKVGLPSLVFTASETVWIKVHAPDEVVSVMMDNVLGSLASLPFVTDVEVILKVEQTVSDGSVYALQPEVRRCLYGHERPPFADKWPFKNYSYSACILYCRAMSQYEYCNCTHHFMSHMVKIPACDVNGLICLNKNKESLENPACTCPMGCEEISYKLVHRFFTRHTVNKTLTARGTRGTVRLAQLPSIRVRRLAMRNTLGLVVDIGGFGGVFFGASLLSVIECIYLICIRRR